MLRHLALIVAAAFTVWLAGAASALAAQPYPVNFHTFDLGTGATSGLTLTGGSLGLASSGLGSFTYVDPSANNAGDGVDGSGIYQSGTWTSDVYPVSFPFNELVSSWNSKTPVGTFVQSEVLPQLDDGHWASKWYVLGRWSYNDSDFHRTSVGGQGDADGFVAIDTFFAKDHPAIAYRLRLTLFRRIGSTATPIVSRYGAVVSNLTNQKNVFPSATTMRGTAVDLNVPQYSQEIHHGEYPEFDNGGEAWCSPTSSQMIIEYWGRTPTPEDLSWVKPGLADPQICHAARYTFDYQYEGCGNWPFNAAYAATYEDMNAAVTRLGSLTDLEQLVAAGIPVITSQSFFKGELTGAGYGTSGHLMTVIGFTADGDVIANDPASPSNDAVRRVYRRREWETIWLRTKRYDANGAVRGGTGGVCYVYWPVDPSARQRRVLRSLGLV